MQPYQREALQPGRPRPRINGVDGGSTGPFGESTVYWPFTIAAMGAGDDNGIYIHFELPTSFSYRMLHASLNCHAQANSDLSTQYLAPVAVGAARFHRPQVDDSGLEYFDFSSPRPESGAAADAPYWTPRRWFTTPYFRGVRVWRAELLPGILRAPQGRSIYIEFQISKEDAAVAVTAQTAVLWAQFLAFTDNDAYLMDNAAPAAVVG